MRVCIIIIMVPTCGRGVVRMRIYWIVGPSGGWTVSRYGSPGIRAGVSKFVRRYR